MASKIKCFVRDCDFWQSGNVCGCKDKSPVSVGVYQGRNCMYKDCEYFKEYDDGFNDLREEGK